MNSYSHTERQLDVKKIQNYCIYKVQAKGKGNTDERRKGRTETFCQDGKHHADESRRQSPSSRIQSFVQPHRPRNPTPWKWFAEISTWKYDTSFNYKFVFIVFFLSLFSEQFNSVICDFQRCRHNAALLTLKIRLTVYLMIVPLQFIKPRSTAAVLLNVIGLSNSLLHSTSKDMERY